MTPCADPKPLPAPPAPAPVKLEDPIPIPQPAQPPPPPPNTPTGLQPLALPSNAHINFAALDTLLTGTPAGPNVSPAAHWLRTRTLPPPTGLERWGPFSGIEAAMLPAWYVALRTGAPYTFPQHALMALPPLNEDASHASEVGENEEHRMVKAVNALGGVVELGRGA